MHNGCCIAKPTLLPVVLHPYCFKEGKHSSLVLFDGVCANPCWDRGCRGEVGIESVEIRGTREPERDFLPPLFFLFYDIF